MKELKDLVAGDDVLVVGRSCRRIAKIDKVTKTQIVVNNARFRRDSGWQCGGDRWNVREISVPTEKDIQDIKEFHEDAEHLRWLYNRMVCEYGESVNFDYMHRFAKIFNKLKQL